MTSFYFLDNLTIICIVLQCLCILYRRRHTNVYPYCLIFAIDYEYNIFFLLNNFDYINELFSTDYLSVHIYLSTMSDRHTW